jgi:WD40 repeat protein/serine/threonine protein kinase
MSTDPIKSVGNSAADGRSEQGSSHVCQVCRTPMATDDVGEFCAVCMLRNAMGGIADPNEESGFGHYQVDLDEDGNAVELGRGAMGLTYKAFDTELKCPVALKVIGERHLGDSVVLRRFLREARAAASLRHPNVASVFHLGRTGGSYFYAMEFVEGETLEQLIRRSGKLEIDLALDIASQATSGLVAIHQQKLIHRDIKPANMMVSLQGSGAPKVKIIDLGLAKSIDETHLESAISTSVGFAGTPEFASPEQFTSTSIDIRSDLYSLGITLWEMVAGRVPFRGTPDEVMYQHRHMAPPIEQLGAASQPISVLLEVLLEKNPKYRFQTPEELLEALEAVKRAIRARRRMVRTIRVNILASADVQKERNLADRLMRSVAAEFNLPVSRTQLSFQRLVEADLERESGGHEGNWDEDDRVLLCPWFSEDETPGSEFDTNDISGVSVFDLVVCIVWSHFDLRTESALTELKSVEANPDRDEPRIPALDDTIGGPDDLELLVYRNGNDPTPPLEPKEARDEFGRQWDTLQKFFAGWETDNPGIGHSVNLYRSLQEFEEAFRNNFRQFLAARVGDRARGSSSPPRIRRWRSSPFRGLSLFSFEHAPIFCGRTKAVGEVLDAMEAQIRVDRPFVIVVGPSGSGKSSLVQAGVLPLLTQPGTIEGIGLWRRAVTRPGAGGSDGDCFDALAAALLEPAALPALQNPESLSGTRDLAGELREHADSVALRVRDALDHVAREWTAACRYQLEEQERQFRASGRPGAADVLGRRAERLNLPKPRLALVVDQLEELFTAGFSAEVRQDYIAALAGLARSGRVYVLATLRSDFYPSYQQYPELIEVTKPSGKVDLRRPTPREIGDIIRLPAEAAGLSFEEEKGSGQRLDEALRDAASATPESLPLLEHVLSLLYEEQVIRGDHLLRWSDYYKLGELKGALAQHAERVFATLESAEQEAFPLVMRHLVTLGQAEEEVPNRRTVAYGEFIPAEEINGTVKAGANGFIDRFIQARLLIADTDPHGEMTVSVAHEALLREWQRVREWLIENREFLRMRDRLDASLKLWVSRGGQADDLLRPGLALAEGEKLAADFASSLSVQQTTFIRASVIERKRLRAAQDRVRYAVMGGITAALIVAVAFGVVSFRQYRRAERQRQEARLQRAEAEQQRKQATFNEQKAKEGKAEADRQAALARTQALFARAAEDRTSEVASQAHLSLARDCHEAGKDAEALAHLAKALRLNQVNYEAAALVGAMLTQTSWPIPVAGPIWNGDLVVSAQFSPDCQRVLTVSNDKTAKLWDVASGKEIGEPMEHDGSVRSAQFSPDSHRVVTISGVIEASGRLTGGVETGAPDESGAPDGLSAPDETGAASPVGKFTARLWDASSGQPIGEPMQHQREVNSAQFSPDGRRIVTASDDMTVQLWDAANGSPLGEPMEHAGEVNSAQFSPDGRLIVTASNDKTAQLWDAARGQPIGEPMQHQGPVRLAQFSPDGERIVTVSDDKTMRIWDAANGTPLGEPTKLENGAILVQFSPDGERIVTVAQDGSARLWDALSGKAIGDPMQHHASISSVQFSPDGQRIVTASRDKTARLWDAASGKPLGEPMQHGAGVYSAHFSPDGRWVVTTSEDGRARVWVAENRQSLGEPMKHTAQVLSARFSPDGQRVLTASQDGTARMWDAASGKPLCEPMRHKGGVSSARFSPDGQRVVTASFDGTARLWDAATGKPLGEPMKHGSGLSSAQFSPDGQRVVTASWDETARLWDTASGKPVGQPMKHGGAVYSAQFSPNGQRVVTASFDGTARLWDAASGEPLGQSMKHGGGVSSAQFSPNGQLLVTASFDGTARLWDATSGQPVGEPMKHGSGVSSAQFSPDGQLIVTTSEDGMARLWEVASGKAVGEAMRHEDRVVFAQFSPDGQRLVTASWDKTARLWNARTGKAIGEPMRHAGWIKCAQFSPDGQRIVTASNDGTARLWDVPTINSKDNAENVLLLADLAEAAGGLSLLTSGQAEIVHVRTPEEIGATLGIIASRFPEASSKLTPLQRFLKWSVSEPRSRAVSPFSELTLTEWIQNRIGEGALDGLRTAMQIDSANPLLVAYFGKALAIYALDNPSDPDETRRARAESDFQTRGALKLAPNNEEIKTLRADVVRELHLSSERPLSH